MAGHAPGAALLTQTRRSKTSHRHGHRDSHRHSHLHHLHQADGTAQRTDAQSQTLDDPHQDRQREEEAQKVPISPSSRKNPAGHSDEAAVGDAMPELRRRSVTQVVRTVSVVKVVDSNGSVTATQTLSDSDDTPASTPAAQDAADTAAATTDQATSPSASQTTISASPASTVSAPSAASTSLVLSAVGFAPSSSSSLPSSSSSTLPLTLSASISTSTTNSTASAGSLSSSSTATGTLLTATSPGNGSTSGNSTVSSHFQSSNTTSVHRTLFSNSTTSTRTSLSSSSSSLYSSSTFSSSLFSSSAPSSVYSIQPLATTDGSNGGAADMTSVAPASTETGSADDASSGPSTGTLVGGVLGGLAGLAVLLLAALMILRWKRRMQHGAHKRLADDADPTDAVARALTGGGGGSGGGSGGAAAVSAAASTAMTERRTTKLLMPLAALAGAKGLIKGPLSPSGSQASSLGEPGEKGFYRVSGRKLPSVLEYGGDGYNDPRDSAVSSTHLSAGTGAGASANASASNTSAVVFRDSMGFFGGEGGPATTPTSRYAVGSPMRPHSGVPVFHPGPGRTATPMQSPVIRQNSNEHVHAGGQLAPPRQFDGIGRSLSSQDGSRGSGSRFTEEI